MEKKTKLLLVDGEQLLHRSFHKFANLHSFGGKPSGAIFGFFKILNSLVFRFNPDHLMVTFDNGKSAHRLKVLPTYKAHRKNISNDYESLHSQKRVIMKVLRSLEVPYIFDKSFSNQYEGDDYIALISHLYKGDVIIVSSDKDFGQLISKRVKQYNPGKDKLISIHNCQEINGYTNLECSDYLILLGDQSDDIPGYKGVGPVKARKFLDEFDSISAFLSKTTNTFPGIDRGELSELYKKNKELIDLKWFIRSHPITVEDLPIKYGKPNKDKLMKIFNKYSLTSLKSNEFLSVFKTLKTWKVKE